MANLIFTLLLAVTTCVTLAKNVDPDDNITDFSCDYAYGRRFILPFRQYYDTQSMLVKGSKRLNVTLPDFGSQSAVSFVCVNVTDVDTETTDVSFSVTNDRFVTVVVTLDEKAQSNKLVDIRALVVRNLWLALQMLK